MERILIGNPDSPLFSFNSASMEKCQCVLTSSLSGDQLAIDQFMPVVYSGGIATYVMYSTAGKRFLISADGKLFSVVGNKRKYPDSIPYGTPIWYYHNDTLIGKFYTQRIMRTGMNRYDILSVSAVGIMDGSMHYGGLYNGKTFAEVASEIIGNEYSFSCTDEVANVLIFGWLPIASKRDNLHQLLFATGVALYKDDGGEIIFRFPEDGSVKSIPSSRIFYGGNIDYRTPATRAEVTEHTFRTSQNDETVTLFDNTNGDIADHTFVSFQGAPIYDLTVTGSIEIIESSVNYAIVSGVGTLSGKKYTHITRVLSAENNRYNATEKTVSVTEATLVNTANSENVLKRVLSYYSSARTIRNDIVLEDEQAGDQVTFENPYGEQEQAFVASLDINVSSFLRASCEMVTGYLPSGGGNNYTTAILLTGSGTWAVPEAIRKKIEQTGKVILISGGQGGLRGENGTSGSYGTRSNGAGGKGGAGGQGGSGGRIFSYKMDFTDLDEIAYSCGVGGEDGELGTDTVFGDQSSASGLSSDIGVTNIFTGATYGVDGGSGVAGADGGPGNAAGQSLTYQDTTYSGGAAGGSNSNGNKGGGGGGAAVGTPGANGSKGYPDFGGEGGSGATPIARSKASVFGNGGDGGHGGGGGGGGGGASGNFEYNSAGGGGGSGGIGGTGGDGCILIYY